MQIVVRVAGRWRDGGGTSQGRPGEGRRPSTCLFFPGRPCAVPRMGNNKALPGDAGLGCQREPSSRKRPSREAFQGRLRDVPGTFPGRRQKRKNIRPLAIRPLNPECEPPQLERGGSEHFEGRCLVHSQEKPVEAVGAHAREFSSSRTEWFDTEEGPQAQPESSGDHSRAMTSQHAPMTSPTHSTSHRLPVMFRRETRVVN